MKYIYQVQETDLFKCRIKNIINTFNRILFHSETTPKTFPKSHNSYESHECFQQQIRITHLS